MNDRFGAPLGGSRMGRGAETLADALRQRGVSRREFLKFCAAMTATLGLPHDMVSQVTQTLEGARRTPAIYLEFQDCAGCTEAMLRMPYPTVAEVVLDILSLNYHETIMAASGRAAEAAMTATIEEGGYLLMVEGSISTKDDGLYCCIGGRTAIDILEEAASKAVAVIAVGDCACFGNIPAANPNPTGAVGVRDLVRDVPVVNMAGCPVNAVNLAAMITHYLTFQSLPHLDRLGRPDFAYGERIHDHCQRRPHFDAGQFVERWGDEGHRSGWCLYKMGCKGPQTYHNCPLVEYNEGTSWPIKAGHPCIGCSEPQFWDTMTPFYRRLPEVPGLTVESNVDTIGLALTGVTAAAIGAHAVGSLLRKREEGEIRDRELGEQEETQGTAEEGGNDGQDRD
jgi:hydrogenase small subunit